MEPDKDNPKQDTAQEKPEDEADAQNDEDSEEYGGRKGPDPVRYGDWEHNGKCVDF